jgi:hypothetical protein
MPAAGNQHRAVPVLGVRTSDSIYRFIHGYQDVVVVEQHSFTGGEAARKLSEDAWQDWIERAFA